MTEKLTAWLCLKTAPGLKLAETLRLLSKFPNPVEFVGKPGHPLYKEEGLSEAVKRHLARAVPPANLEQIRNLCQHYQIDLLCYTDGDYPLALRHIYAPPLIIYHRGDLVPALNKVCLGVVGTRKPSAYGREMCKKLLGPVCQRGITVISGLAMGIDTLAHETALANKAPTLAVLASGVEQTYPPANRELAQKIIHQGALLSEYEPGTKLEQWNFPARNRIISALSQAVFIVEGPMSSGALLTAKHAIEQNREVMALPGNINHPNAQGPNYLIKTGAQCITCPEDILTSLGLEAELKEQIEFLPVLSADEQKLFDLIKTEQRELVFDELLLLSGHNIGKLSTLLLNLELKGYICKAGGNSFILA